MAENTNVDNFTNKNVDNFINVNTNMEPAKKINTIQGNIKNNVATQINIKKLDNIIDNKQIFLNCSGFLSNGGIK